jgi:hypothetical protein
MPEKGDILDNTEESLDEVIYRIEDTLKDIGSTVAVVPEHLNNLLSRVAHLELLQAAKEVPAAIADVGEGGAKAAGDTIGAGAAAVGTVPAAATDVLEDAESVGGDVGKGTSTTWKKYRLKRRK